MNKITQCRECGYGYQLLDGVDCACPNCDRPYESPNPKQCEKCGYQYKNFTDDQFCINCIHDKVNHPSHYGGDQPYEVIKVLEAWFPDEQSEAFCLCNAIKYIARAGKKTPDKLEDLKKAQWYLNRVIENLKNT